MDILILIENISKFNENLGMESEFGKPNASQFVSMNHLKTL